MMEELEITYEQVDRVILCGAFGTYMNAKSAAKNRPDTRAAAF